MKKAAPWILVAVLSVALVATYAELQRMRGRFYEVSRHHFHDHQDIREFVIQQSLEGVNLPVVVLGDSLVELADFPRSICGRRVVNAGIGGSQASDFIRIGPKILSGVKPTAIVVALGANGGTQQEMEKLLHSLSSFSSVIIPMSTTSDAFEPADLIKNSVHLTRSGSAKWVARIVSSVEQRIGECS